MSLLIILEKHKKSGSFALQEWLRYQALWDLQPDTLFEILGTNLNKWMNTLTEIKWDFRKQEFQIMKDVRSF